VLHEFGHAFGAHLTHEFDNGIAKVAADLVLLALNDPDWFEHHVLASA
jgi:hypothetical protein